MNSLRATVAPRVVVRITTERWSDDRGLVEARRLRFLRRHCREHNFLEEDIHCAGADEVLDRVLNWRRVPDGVYEVFTTNLSSDWETGLVDDWDYRLEPLRETTTETL